MQENILYGKNWTAKKIGERYVLSLKNHTELIESITDFITQEKITAGVIQGIGATNKATLRFFNPETKKYEDKTFAEQMEIANLTGNIAQKDGIPLVHLHITLGRSSYTALAGHLLSAYISGAGEILIDSFKDIKIEKSPDSETGLNLYDFDKQP